MTFQHKYPDSRNCKSADQGTEFQDLVVEKCSRHFNLHIQCYSSERYQRTKGESVDGTEIKRDNHCTRTGRLSIEIAEKTHERLLYWIPSGIDSATMSRVYIQGNTTRFWVFESDTLRNYWVIEDPEIHENTPTIRSFYITIPWANRHAKHIWSIDMKGAT